MALPKNDLFLQALKYNPAVSCDTKLIPFELTWTLNGVDKLSDDAITGTPLIWSTIFTAPPDKITTPDKRPLQFEMCFCPKGNSLENHDFVAMYLKLKNHSGLNVMFAFSIVMQSGERVPIWGSVQKFEAPDKLSWGKSEMMLFEELYEPENRFVVDGKLVLHCEVNIIVTELSKPDLSDQLQEKYSQPVQVINSFAILLESGAHSDVTLVMVDDGEEKLRAHKSILVARSKVFAEMFSFEMAESTSNRVEIQGVTAKVFQQVLQYIYTGRVQGPLGDTAQDLLICADKYQLDSLKSICEEYLCSQINAKSESDLFRLAYICGATKLKKAILEFKRKTLIRALLENPEMVAQNLLAGSFIDEQDLD